MKYSIYCRSKRNDENPCTGEASFARWHKLGLQDEKYFGKAGLGRFDMQPLCEMAYAMDSFGKNLY